MTYDKFMDSIAITKSLFQSFTIASSDNKFSNPKDWKGVSKNYGIYFNYLQYL